MAKQWDGLLFRRVSLPDYITGKMYLHPMPGRFEKITQFVNELEQKNIRKIICLTGLEEISRISPDYHALIKKHHDNFHIECFPIPDFGVPDDPEAFLRLARLSSDQVKTGEAVLIHCGMGIGRTGLFGVLLLMVSGLTRKDAEFAIQSAGAGVQTNSQKEFISWAESRMDDLKK